MTQVQAGTPSSRLRPLSFLWGVATSAYQIEGGIEGNDWPAWEAVPRRIKDGARAGAACLSWERWEEDLDLICGLGLNAYRFSIEWSRIEPTPGRYDEDAIRRYGAMLDGCRARSIEPVLTLHHFTNPAWFASAGGWEERQNLDAFRRFARLAAERFGDRVDLWITLNEPEVYGFYAYDSGIFPPGVRDRARALVVIANMIEAHGLAAQEIRDADRIDADGDGKPALLGAAKHWTLLEPRRPWSPLDRLASHWQHLVFNEAVVRALAGGPIDFRLPGLPAVRRTVDALRGSSDFIGVNYYTRWQVSALGNEPLTARPGAPVSDLGWEIHPDGLETVLLRMARFGLPLLVTENGIADAEDRWRPEFLRASLAALDRARRLGVDVRGYFHWSLFDNFEWADGHSGRFGLYRTDFENPRDARIERPSARVYASEVARRSEAPRVSPR
ncbi:MAG TPA: glycoside hydrolase family 1 protein [Candidatus Eisenbacteria bacterium]|nr:glycoside hydrolase family 1 protein [Candidatus Eisenbacteria bacterium]